jgi:diguanylate cyclase (GGDEF)-like protein
MAIAVVASSTHADRLLAVLRDAPAPAGAGVSVLVIDAEPATAEHLHAHLPRSEAEVISACTVEAARALLLQKAVALIVCNPAVAGEAPWRFFSQLTVHAASAGIPVIVLKNVYETLVDSELYSMGVDAILTAPYDRGAMVALVRARLKRIRQQGQSQLQDLVTGQPNIRAFEEAFQRAASLAAREHEPLTLMLLHVDDLARIRREQGARQADEVLRGIARGAAGALRQSDLLARGSGDSLLVLLPNTDEEGARRVTEKVHDRLARLLLLTDGAAGAGLMVSAGSVMAAPQASFVEVLEAAAAELEPLRSAVERAFAPEQEPAATTLKRIMIAEDDDLTASIIKHRLERLGYEVIHVTDGAAVLERVPDADVSLLILDVKMPYVDGFEALRRLRSIRALRHLPVMMVTSMGNEEDIAHGFALGADDYLVKPFSPIELQARVQRMLRPAA